MEQTVKFKQNGETAEVKFVEGRVVVKRGDCETPFRPQYTFEEIAGQFKANGWEEVSEIEEKADLFAAPQHLAPTPPVVSPSQPKPIEKTGNVRVVPLEHGMGLVEEPEQLSKSATQERDSYLAEVIDSANKQNITISKQQEVDEYLELHEQISELKKRQDELKGGVREYMEANKIDEISGTRKGKVVLQKATASNSTNMFSDYELEDIKGKLEEELLNQVTETRVNAVKLEALLKIKALPTEVVKEIKSLKVCKPGTPRFTVKK